MAALGAEACRCHDGRCLKRYDCQRWLEREVGRTHSWSLYQHATEGGVSLADAWPEPCRHLIEVQHG